MFVSVRCNFLSHLGLPGSSGLPEKLQKHAIFGLFWPNLDIFGEHAHIGKDTRPYRVPNVRLGRAELFNPFRVAGLLRVARKMPKNAKNAISQEREQLGI